MLLFQRFEIKSCSTEFTAKMPEDHSGTQFSLDTSKPSSTGSSFCLASSEVDDAFVSALQFLPAHTVNRAHMEEAQDLWNFDKQRTIFQLASKSDAPYGKDQDDRGALLSKTER
jgi:hypothetical protein